jgi:gliding motility-associated-like protein
VNPIPNTPSIFSNAICDGDSLILIAVGACDSIEWTGPFGGSFIGGDTLVVLSGTLNYIDGGDWTASCINTSTNCQSLLANHRVQIRPTPAKPIINNNGPVCIGESVELSTPIVIGASYNWYTGDSTQLIGPGPIRNIPNITSDTIFLLSIELNGCSNSDTTHVGIYAQPASPILPDTIEACEFDTLYLTTSTIQTTYLWRGPNGFNSTEQDPFVYPATIADAGQYHLIIKDINTCPSAEDSVLVIINSLPTAPNITVQNSSVCNGDTLFLFSDQNCGLLLWEGPSGMPFLDTSNIFIDSFNLDYQNGDWTVLCVDTTTGCEVLSNTLTTTIRPLPATPIIANTSPICVGDSVDLSMSLVAGASYQWFAFDSTRIDTVSAITIAGLENDTIFYGVIVVDGCGSFDTTHVLVNPRPATPSFLVQFDTLCTSNFIQFTIGSSNPIGLTYDITGPNGYTSSGINSMTHFIFPIDTNYTGTYYVTAIDVNGCKSFDASVSVVVLPDPPKPVLTGTGFLCDGDSIRLQGPSCGDLYWYPPSGGFIFTSGTSTLTVGPGEPGYMIGAIGQPWQVQCFSNSSVCIPPVSEPFIVTISELPSSINPTNNGPVCFNGSVTLSVAQQATPSTYIWSTDSLLTDTIGTGTTIILDSITTDTIFYIEVKNAYGCSTIDSTHVLLSTPLLVPDVDAIDSVLCEGDDINLFEFNYAIGHQWTGPNGFASNSQSPTITTATANQSGVYSVFVIDGNGCPSPVDSITIVINPLPVAPIISGGNNVCDGDNLLLSTNTICDSAVWVSSLDTILGTGNLLSLDDLDAGYGNTTWTLFCYNTVSGCFDSSNVLAVNLIPSPPLPIISNNNPVCAGDSAILITSVVFGTSSVWYSDSLLIDSIGGGDTLIINNITSDSIVYLQQSLNGCLSPIVVDTIFYIPTAPIPNIGGDQDVCQGDSIYLTTTTLASAYLWTDSSGFTSTQQNPIIPNASLADIGTYHLFLTDNNGCAAPPVSLQIDVNLLPAMPIIHSNDTTCNGDTLLFGSNRPLDVRIEWVTPNNDTFVTDSLVVITSDSLYYQFGQWTVLFTDTLTGCQVSKDTIFRIETIPTVGLLTNSGPVCLGDSVVLSSAQIAGVTDYFWFDGNPTFVGGGQSITVPNIVGYTFFGLAVRTSLGCNYFMDSNFVSIHPPSASAPINVDVSNCVGDLVQFSTDPATGYVWTGPNGVFSYQQNPIIGPVTTLDSGFYTLSVIDSNGCSTLDTSVFVNVSGPPTAPIASALSSICQGDTLYLNSTAGSCDSAYWVGPGNRILPGANAIIPSDSSDYVGGNWQVFCVDQGSGCETGSNSINISIQTLAISNAINNGPVCFNDSVQLTANFVAGANYLWFADSLMIDTIGFTQIINIDSISSDSTFYVVLINSNGCVSPQGQTTVNVLPLAPPPNIGSNVRVCEGENIQLTTTLLPLFGHRWTGPNGFTSNQRNPLIQNADLSDAGTYTLSIIGLNGCHSADTSLQVIVDSLPDAPTIAGFVYLCENDTLFLSSDSVSNHCDSVQWIGPNGINYPVIGQNVMIPPGDTNHIGGLWQIQCIDTSTNCFSISNLSLVVIFPNPDTVATTDDGPICIGGTVNLSTAVLNAGISYTWYADTSLTNISGTGTNPAIQNITTDTTFYLVLTNIGGCTSDPIPTPVQIYPPGNAPLVSVDTQYCVGDSIFLITPTIATSYYWTSNNGFVDSVQNPFLTGSATLLDSGLYTLSVIDSNGCVSRDTSFRITINAIPLSPSLVSNSPICFGDDLQLSSSGQCGQSQWIGPLGNSAAVLGTVGGGNNLWTTGTSTSIPASDSSYGNASWYMICIDPLTGCRAISNTITVVVHPTPSISLISNTGAVCVGDSVGLSVTASSPGATPLITWYSDAALTQPVGIGATINVSSLTSTTTFFAVVSDPVTGCAMVDSTVVTVYSVSPAPNMPANSTLCEGDLLSLSTTTIANGYNWTGPNGFVDNGQSPTPFVSTILDAGTYYLSLIDSNNCPSVTGSVDVIINPQPSLPFVSNSGPGCTGDSIVLMASTVLGATYDWFKLPTGTNIGQGQNYTLSNVSLVDTGSYYVVVTLNGCTATSDSTLVTIYNNNNVMAVVGNAQSLCGVDTTTITAAIPPINTTGFWTTNSGATIVNPNNPTTLVANLPIGTNVFYWTLSNATCSNLSFDSLVIDVSPPSIDTAHAGVNQDLCGASTATLFGNSPILSSGTWTQSAAQAAAGVVINTSNNPATNLTGLIPGNSYTFVWTFDNGACGIHSTDTIDISVAIAPSIPALAGNNIITCTPDTLSLNAINPSVGTGIWTTNSSAVIITPTQATTIISNIQQDTTVFIWTLSNGVCSNYASDSMFVILGGASPIANADVFNVLPSNSAILIDVLPNDLLTTNWDIYINTPTNSGQMLNLNNGEFELNLQGVTNNQSFIYELCNPVCPANCDTALVILNIGSILECDVPNIFTPNEDGVNDLFEVPCLVNGQIAKLLVFNRWGDLVYQSDNYQNQWNGTHQGMVLPDGTYFYILKIGEEDQIQGSIELRR